MTQPRALLFALGVAIFLTACGIESQPTITIENSSSDMVDVPEEVLRASSNGDRQTFATATTVLYLNFEGGVIKKGSKSDASTNTSFIGGGTVPPFNGDQATKDQVITTVKKLYEKYNIQIVTTRPGSGDYDMAMIGGSPSDIGLAYSTNVTGVAPMDCDDKMPRDIAFVFSDNIKALMPSSKYAQKVSETTAHESGHTYGLPHSDDGCDLMSYKSCSQLKTFLNKQMAMQPDSYGKCGLTSMNSHELLVATLGTASTQPPPPPPPPASDTEPPKVSITAPAAGAKVGATTTVTATITDNTAVTKADLLVDGKVAGTTTKAPYQFQVQLSTGSHTLAVNAYDAAGNKGTGTVTVTVDAPAPPPPPPGPGPDTTPPKVSITSPSEGATVSPLITLKATVTDNTGVAKVELLLDGKLQAELTAAPFDFKINLPGGKHTLRVEGLDAAGNRGSTAVTVTVDVAKMPDPGTTSPGPTTPGTAPPPGSYGTECQSADDCTSGLCAEDEVFVGKYCTETCDPTTNSCPTGAGCYPTNAEDVHVCGPPEAGAENPADGMLLGGCSVAPERGGASPALLLLMLLPLVLRRSRR
jgi:hypothetical protein